MLTQSTGIHSASFHREQTGTSMIEVLVAMLLLSIGLLALAAVMSFAVQLPKLSGYRMIAVNLASSHVDRIRANPGEFQFYAQPLHKNDWSTSEVAEGNCTYPDCYVAGQHKLQVKDDLDTRRAIRAQLPAGDMMLTCDSVACSRDSHGNLWIVWQEPQGNATFDASTSDNCPAQVAALYPALNPRCLYMRFSI